MSDDQVTDKATESATDEEANSTETLTIEQLKAERADAQKRIKELNKENADRRKKLEAFEAEKAAKDAESMSELEKAKAALDKITPELETLRKEKQALLLQGQFEKMARALKLEFANERAQEDAYRLLDTEAIGEDGKGLKEALTSLQKDRPYLFTKLSPQDIDAKQKGKIDGELISSDILAAKRQGYGAL